MPKPTEKSTVKEMKDYIRQHKLNKGNKDIRLGMNRAELITGLKKRGHWGEKKKHPPIPPNIKGKKKKASGNTIAGQLLDLPLDISDKIGKAVKEERKLDYYEFTNSGGGWDGDEQIRDMVKRFKPDGKKGILSSFDKWIGEVSGGNAGYTGILTKAKAKVIKKKYPLLTVKSMGEEKYFESDLYKNSF